MSAVQTVNQTMRRADVTTWLDYIERLRRALTHWWGPDEAAPELVQTHISAVFLGRRFAFKVKKPVDFGFLDYTTPEKRRLACEAEVSLNRRLCPDVYLHVQSIRALGEELQFDSGPIVDYGVLMQRLPATGMLDHMVAAGTVTEAILDRVAQRLAAFHQRAERGPDIDSFGLPPVIRGNWDENFVQIQPYAGRTLAIEDEEAIRHWIDHWFSTKAPLLHNRVRDGRICDGHGDVRCESICVTDDRPEGICIFDCIEFNDRFRYGDVASEAAFLAMDLDVRGRPDLGYFFTERYAKHSGDQKLWELLPFYRCYRAFVRGKVLSFLLDEGEFSEAERADAARRATQYFDQAGRYARPLKTPTAIVVGGLSGSGKTSLARALAGELGLRVVSSDIVRTQLYGDISGPCGYAEGAYNEDANQRTYATLISNGRALLKSDCGVVLDATFQRASDRRIAREMARAGGAAWRFIECRLAPEHIQGRLEKRARTENGGSAADWDIYLRQQKEFEPTDVAEADEHLVLETDAGLVQSARRAADWLHIRDGEPR